MSKTLERDNATSTIPGKNSLPPGVTKGDAMRPPADKLNVSHGPGGSSPGHAQKGSHITGFHGSPPSVGGKSMTSVRNQSNPKKAS